MTRTISKLFFVIITLFSIRNLFSQELNKQYLAQTKYGESITYQSYFLTFTDKETFKYKYYNYQGDYEKIDSITGKWKILKNTIHFFDIDQPNHIIKKNIKENKGVINVEENCVGEYDPKDRENIYLITLDKKFQILEFIESNFYHYDLKNETLKISFKLNKTPYQIIYIRKYPNVKIEKNNKQTNYFDWGINLVDFKKNNHYQIRNCWKFYGDLPKQILNPYFSLKVNSDSSLESVKKFYLSDGNSEVRKFKIEGQK